MDSMFLYASSFNQLIDSWNVSQVISMDLMFAYDSSFDNPIGSWDVSHVTSLVGMFSGVTLSVQNYDNLLLGWASQNLSSNLYFDAGNSKYSNLNGNSRFPNAEFAREHIITHFGWKIIDGGQLTTPTSPVLEIFSGNHFIYLNWTLSNEGGSPIIKYNLYRGTKTGVYSFFSLTTNSFFNDTDVELNVEYYYVVSALNAKGESEFSNELSATAQGVNTINIPSAPNVVIAAGNQSVYLSWSAPDDKGFPIIEYQVFRGVLSGQYSFVGITSNLYFNDTELISGKQYFYVVVAVNENGKGDYSVEMFVAHFCPYSHNQISYITITQTSTTTLPGTTVTQQGSTITNHDTNTSTTNISSNASPGFDLFTFVLTFSMIIMTFLFKKNRK
jgi:fibronectin type 3 domain-containing protein